jgi:tetratricopeptide (TPR) repeat protein
LVLDGQGAEVDWFVGYDPPAEKFEASLAKITAGDGTFKALTAAYARNPKDVPTVFGLARKWSERYDEAKANEKYREVIALDPQGQAGTYTQDYYKITVPYTEFAEFTIATASLQLSQKPDLGPVRAFLAKYPKSPLAKQAYQRMSSYFGYSAPKDEAAKFFAEYADRFPADPMVLNSWLSRIVRDKEPLDKGAELAAKVEQMTSFNPSPSIQSLLAQFALLKGDKAKAEELYGKTFMDDRTTEFGYDLVGYANFWVNRSENLESAVAAVETALKLQPDSAYFLSQAATAYLKMGREEKALALYGPAFAKKNAADASALSSYAGFWARQGKNLDDALAAAKKAAEAMPGAYYIWMTLSQVQEKLKNVPEAVKALEKAIELAPEQVKETYRKNLERLKASDPAKK